MALRITVLPPQKNLRGFKLEDVWQEWFLESRWTTPKNLKVKKLLARRGLNNFWRSVGETDEGIPLSALVSDF